MQIENIALTKEIMRIDTGQQTIDMQQIGNRRFLYNPKIGILVLGRQYAKGGFATASHAAELAAAGITEGYDDFVRGWIGTGRDLKEWVDGMNEMFTEAGILKDGSKFEDVFSFQYGELSCLLYPFDDVKLEIGKLAMWRLQTHENFGGTWLSDFVPNRLGGFIGELAPEPEKLDCALIGQDGNILYGEGWAHTQAEMLERGLTLHQYENFARLRNALI